MGIRAGEGVTLAGSALSDTSLSIDAARELRLDGSALAYGGTLRLAGNDVLLGATSKTQGRGIDITATRDLRASGSSVSAGAAQLKAGRDAACPALAADGDTRSCKPAARRAATASCPAPASCNCKPAAMPPSGSSLRSNGDLTADAGGKLALLGNASATTGALNLTSVGDLSIGKDAGPAGGAMACARRQLHHRRDGVAASADHQRGGAMRPSTASCWRAVRCPSMRSARSRPCGLELQARARCAWMPADADAGRPGRDNAGMTLAGTDLRVDGSAMAYGGALSLTAGRADAGRDGQSAGQRPAANRPAASCRPTARSRASRISACRPMPTPW